MTQVVVLDDYQHVAADSADWSAVDGSVRFVHEHLVGDELVDVLSEATVVVAMRERTAFDADLLERLERLTLLVTTGGANASIDVAAAARHGVTVCGTRSLPSPAAEMTWALLLAPWGSWLPNPVVPLYLMLAGFNAYAVVHLLWEDV